MTSRFLAPRYLAFCALMSLAACGSEANNPFDPNDGDDAVGGEGGGGGGPISRDGLPPGTDSPTPSSTIFRREAEDGNGNGFARDISYDSATDTFTVDNLAFDGDSNGRSNYARGTQVSSLGPFAVYENDSTALDLISAEPVAQLAYRAIYGVSSSGNSQFAIVRTGSYIPYGFGGFVYQRDTGVTLPSTGQASYRGQYAGLRDFDGVGGLEYTTANAAIQIDFEDFNNGQGVRAQFTDRTVFDLAGQDVTQDIINAYNDDNPDNTISALPVIQFVISDGSTDANGEIIGSAFSTLNGQNFETGNYYALISGQNAEEIAGIVVVTSADPRFDVTVRETGGFIVTRPTAP